MSCVCRRAGSYAPELNAGPARHSDIDIALAILSGENVRTEIIKNDFAVGKHEEKIISQVQVRPSRKSLDPYSLTLRLPTDQRTRNLTNIRALSTGYSRRLTG